MPKFMKLMNNISRSQAVFRGERIAEEDLAPGHFALVLAICREPGRSQEELARELCLNKSTVARALGTLEEAGYIQRTPLISDKRQLSVHPTERMLAIHPRVREVSAEWQSLLTEGIGEEELAVFHSVLARMEARARALTVRQEEAK